MHELLVHQAADSVQIGRLLLKALGAVAMTASAAGGITGQTMPCGSGRDVERIGLIGRQSQLQISIMFLSGSWKKT